MTETRSYMSAEAMVSTRDELLALPVIMSGVLDAKIAETKTALEALATGQAVASTVAEADAIKAQAQTDADAILAKARQDADAMAASAKIATDAAAEMYDKATAREQETTKSAKDLAAATVELQDSQQRLNEQMAGLQSRLDALKEFEASLDTREAKLVADQAAFNKKLDALRA